MSVAPQPVSSTLSRPVSLSLPVLQAPRPTPRPAPAPRTGARVATFAVTFGLLAAIQLLVARPMLLAERFVRHAGWAEALLLSVYAAWLVGHLLVPREIAQKRQRLWLAFSVVFFGQLLIGLAGADRFLMSGNLHLPVPAMIVAGPLFRGAGLFMPVLLVVTLLLVGPGWCSYLCYIGAWDLKAAREKKHPGPLPRWRGKVRVGLLVLVAAVATGLHLAGVGSGVAVALGAGFGLLGVAVMVVFSRRTGTMVHCTTYCPIGVVATVGGRLSPFRLRIADGCDDCGACGMACRYDALRPEDIARRRPNLSCTLCGECVRYCRERLVEYRFLGLSAENARTLFFVLVASLHAVFLGVARI